MSSYLISTSSNSRGSRYFRPILFRLRICLTLLAFLFSTSSSAKSISSSLNSSFSTSSSSLKRTNREQTGLFMQNLLSCSFDSRSKMRTQPSKLAEIRCLLETAISVTVVVIPLYLPTTSQFFLLSQWKISPISLLRQQLFSQLEIYMQVILDLRVPFRAMSEQGLLLLPRISQIRSLLVALRMAWNLPSRMKAASTSSIGTSKSSSSCLTFLPFQETTPFGKLAIQGTIPLPQSRYSSPFFFMTDPTYLLGPSPLYITTTCGLSSPYMGGETEWMLPSD